MASRASASKASALPWPSSRARQPPPPGLKTVEGFVPRQDMVGHGTTGTMFIESSCLRGINQALVVSPILLSSMIAKNNQNTKNVVKKE